MESDDLKGASFQDKLLYRTTYLEFPKSESMRIVPKPETTIIQAQRVSKSMMAGNVQLVRQQFDCS
jgi:hypothetical protein